MNFTSYLHVYDTELIHVLNLQRYVIIMQIKDFWMVTSKVQSSSTSRE